MRAGGGRPPHDGSRPRAALALRYLLLSGLVIGVVGLAGHWVAWPILTSTLGPTAYTFVAHPESETSRFRNALIGHSAGLGVGLGVLIVFGLLHCPPVSTTGTLSFLQAAAAATAVGVTVAVLELTDSHHAPAAATALLVTTGQAKPRAPLIGLALGLAIVITLGPLIGRLPLPAVLAPRTRRAANHARGDEAALGDG